MSPLIFVALGLSAPSPEEQALRLELSGKPEQAVQLLRSQSADLPELARYAAALSLRHRLPTGNLLLGPEGWKLWARVDQAKIQGRIEEALSISLQQMDAILAGSQKRRLATTLLDWGRQRPDEDRAGALPLLEAALALGPEPEPRRAIEDELLRRDDGSLESIGEIAALRLISEPTDILAALAVTRRSSEAAAVWSMLEPIWKGTAEPAQKQVALLLVVERFGLQLPPSWIQALFLDLSARVPRPMELEQPQLNWVAAVGSQDPDQALKLLEPLLSRSATRERALDLQANLTVDPWTKAQILNQLAAEAGSSTVGTEARRRLVETVRAALAASPDHATAGALAEKAKSLPGINELPELAYYLLSPEDARDPARLEVLARRSPGDGPWCTRLVTDAIEKGTAERLKEVSDWCADSPGTDAAALRLAAVGADVLMVTPKEGSLELLVSGAVEVAQQSVDPLELLKVAEGHPLETHLDADLLEPQQSWTVQADAARALHRLSLRPRGKSALVALTLRVGELQTTTLVPTRPVQVQAIRQEGRIYVAAFDTAPLHPREVWLRDDRGLRRLDVGSNHIAAGDVEGAATVLVRNGDAIGYAVVADDGVGRPSTTWGSAVVLDRAVRSDGELRAVLLFGKGTFLVESLRSDGSLVQARTLVLNEEGRREELWLVGGGRLRMTAEGFYSQQNVGVNQPDLPLSLRLLPDGSALELSHGLPLQPEGLPLHLRLHRGALMVDIDQQLQSRTLRIPLPAGTDARLDVSLSLSGLPPVALSYQLSTEATPSAPRLPELIRAGTPLPPSPSLRIATQGERRVWIAPEEQRLLPTPGTWQVATWRAGRQSAATPITVVEEAVLDQGAVWRGKATLVWTGQEPKILLSGQNLTGNAQPGWLMAPGLLAPLEQTDLSGQRSGDRPRAGISSSSRRSEAGVEATIEFGLPAGSSLWSWVRDASDQRDPEAAPGLRARPLPPSPSYQAEFVRSVEEGQQLAAGLLAEEERLREATQVQRMSYDYSPAMEQVYEEGISGSGWGAGGMGSAGSSGYGAGRTGQRTGLSPFNLAYLPNVLGYTEAENGPWKLSLPGEVSDVDLYVVARLPDGQWLSQQQRISLEGTPVVIAARPMEEVDLHRQVVDPRPAPPLAAPTHRNDRTHLEELALSLPAEGRALAALLLMRPGEPESPLITSVSPTPIQNSVRRKLLDPQLPLGSDGGLLQRLADSPDSALQQRAALALQLANSAPDRSLAAARRLLREAALPAWVRAQAGLALYLSGAEAAEIDQALSDPDAVVQAVRVLAGLQKTATIVPIWQIALADTADPLARAVALGALGRIPATSVPVPGPVAAAALIDLRAQSPLASAAGRSLPRSFINSEPSLPTIQEVPAGRPFPVEFSLAPLPVPTTLLCPRSSTLTTEVDRVALDPGDSVATCWLRGEAPGPLRATVRRDDVLGRPVDQATLTLTILPPASSNLDDPMSVAERTKLAIARAEAGKVEADVVLLKLLGQENLPTATVAELVNARLKLAMLLNDPVRIVRTFEALRERRPQAGLERETAARVAHAYAATGEPARALAATRVVLDSAFQEDLDPVRGLHARGLTLTALKLLKELIAEQPELPSVMEARFLVPGLLLERAEGDGDRLGYTRSSLRHTAAAELAGLLLAAPDDSHAPMAALMLLNTLERIGEPGRMENLAGALARRYARSPQGPALSIGEARVHLEADRPSEVLRVLKSTSESPLVWLLRGRAYERLGQREQAVEAYSYASMDESTARLTKYARRGLDPAAWMTVEGARIEADLEPGTQTIAQAWPLALERLVLRSNGGMDPGEVVLDGLPGGGKREATVGMDGDLALPALQTGAYLLSLDVGGDRFRTVALVDGLSIQADTQGYGVLLRLQLPDGRPAADAKLWVFGTDGGSSIVRTSPDGSAWIAARPRTVLARDSSGRRYGYLDLSSSIAPSAPAPARSYEELENLKSMGYIDSAPAGFDDFLNNEAAIQADAL